MAVQQHVLNWLYSVLTSEYQDVNRTYNDVAQALSQFSSLSPRTDVHTFPNGASALLLHLSGTLPAVFRGATYRYPVSVWVPHAYPHEAPLIYVTPTENMMVRPGQHVDPQGQVYHPYLVGWSEFWDKSTLVDFLAILRDIFAKEPPVIARQTVARPPSTAPTATPTPPPIPPLPQELAARSRPTSVVQQAPAPPPKGTAAPATTPATVAATTSPSPPPVPPHPHASTRQSLAGALHESRFGPAAAASTSSSPSPPPPPPVPGRPAYQQSPLGQPPLQQQQAYLPQQPQPQYNPPYSPDLATQQQLPPQLPPPQEQPAYYQYPPSQHQQPQPQQQQQQPLPPWAQQQQQLLQQQPLRTRAPPPPDIMDEDDGKSVGGTANGGVGSPAAPPPPVPPNPEKDALLRELARVLAQSRQRSRDQDAATLAGLQAQRTAMMAAAQQMQKDMSDVGQLSSLLTANTAMLHETLAAADSVVARGQQTRPPAIDELLVGPTVVAAQLYDLVAEERALADAVFMLGRAVEHGRISPPVFAKMTRQLAREWYLKKALVRKIGRGMGLLSV